MGRPRKDIDGVQVRRLAALGCTQADVGEYFGVSEATIRGRFCEDFRLGHSDAKYSLRRMQWKQAASGDGKMLIHLGKTYLGQTDRIDLTSKGQSLTPMPYEVGDDGRNPDLPLPGAAAGVLDDDS